ncbi:hypothetical protein [Subtercola sp. YIM 133946]|uniref:hypothetical protein n=1 Tax=Subtercola sp. YIM 133946 TaxID=3118909 RepID=UPI002F9418B8
MSDEPGVVRRQPMSYQEAMEQHEYFIETGESPERIRAAFSVMQNAYYREQGAYDDFDDDEPGPEEDFWDDRTTPGRNG